MLFGLCKYMHNHSFVASCVMDCCIVHLFNQPKHACLYSTTQVVVLTSLFITSLHHLLYKVNFFLKVLPS